MTKTKKESRGGGEGVKRRPCFSANDWRQAQEEQRLIDLLLEIPPSDHLPSFLVYKISSILLDSPERDAELVQVELMDLAMLVTSGPDLSEAQRLMALSLFHDLLFLSWLKTVSTQPTLPSSSALWCVDQLAEASRWTLNTKVYSNLVLALKLERLCLEALTLASCVFPREDNEAGSGDFVAMLVEEQPYLAIGMLAEWPPTLSDGSKAIKTSILSIKAFVSLLKALSLLPSLDDDDETESAASRDGDPMGDERARCLTSISYIALDPLTNVPQLKELCLICLERYLCDWQSSLSSSTPSGLILLHEAIEQLMGLLDDPQGTLKEVGMPSKTRVKCRVLLWKASALTPPPSLATPLSAAVADPVLESILKSPLLLPSPSLSLPSFLPHQWTLLPATQIKEPLNVSSSIIPVSLSFESGLYSASYWSVRVSSWVVAILTPGLPLPAPWTSLYPPLPSPDALIDKDVGSKDDDDEDEDEEDELQMRHESSLAVRDEVDECLGPNPYSPLALTLALLELITSLLLIDGLDGSLLPLLAHMASSSSSLMIDPVQQRALLRAVSCIPRLANSIPIFLSSKTGSDFDFTNHAVKLAVSLSNHMAAAHEMERSQGIAMSRDKALGMEGAREVSQLLPLAMFFPNILIQR